MPPITIIKIKPTFQSCIQDSNLTTKTVYVLSLKHVCYSKTKQLETDRNRLV